MALNNAISWFEIGVADLDRATKFYEDIFGDPLIPMDMKKHPDAHVSYYGYANWCRWRIGRQRGFSQTISYRWATHLPEWKP